jgi:hypothetical protein
MGDITVSDTFQTNGYVETYPYSGSGTLNFNTEMSAEIGEIALALSQAQSELESAHKDQSGYGYNYSDLASVINTAKPVLAKHGLAITQLLGNDGDKPGVTTILVHKSGQYFKSYASLPLVEMKGCNEAQRAGSVYTYLRRYAYQAILGMSSEDNDASSEGSKKTSFSGKKASTTKSKPEGQKFRRKKAPTAEVEDEI